MPAYKVRLQKKICGCGKPALYEVRNTYDALCGDFCARCAERKVKDLNKGTEISNG